MAPLTKLERAVLTAISSTHGHAVPGLQNQFDAVTVTTRENTGAGFFVELALDREAVLPVNVGRKLDGPHLNVDGIEFGVGTILFFEEGYPCLLEGYVFADDTSDVDFSSVRFTEVAPPAN